MAEADKPKRRARPASKPAVTGDQTQETKRAAPKKRVAPGTRKTAHATRAPKAKGAAPTVKKPEAGVRAQSAVETATEADTARLPQNLREGIREVAAQSRSDLTAAFEAIAAAEAVAKLSHEIGKAGAGEILAGRKVLSVSEDVASESLTVRALSAEDLDIGLALAGIAGQLQSISGALDRIGTATMAGVLTSKGEQLKGLADALIARAGATAALARTLAETSLTAAVLGEEEVADGRARLATSEWEQLESEELVGEGLGLMTLGLVEASVAEGLEREADGIAGQGDGHAAMAQQASK